jgi:hypothetical protein
LLAGFTQEGPKSLLGLRRAIPDFSGDHSYCFFVGVAFDNEVFGFAVDNF